MLNKLVDIQIVFYSLIFVKGSIYVDYVKYVKAAKKGRCVLFEFLTLVH